MAMRVARGWSWAAWFGLVGSLPAAGCHELSFYPEDCRDQAACPGNACPGACVPLLPLGFDGPALLWIGPAAGAPECPAEAPQRVYEGWAEPTAPHECPPCACTEPACVFPEGVTASNTDMCLGPQFTELGAPVGWAGGCVSAGAVIPASGLGSVTIAPVTARACEVAPQPVPSGPGPVGWGVLALGCQGEVMEGLCNDAGKMCVPAAGRAAGAAGFRQCVMFLGDGEPACPEEYPEGFRFHEAVEDTRACSECACTEAVGPSCTAMLSTFQDEGCSQGLLSLTVGLGAMASCNDIPDPSASLGSMSASWVTNAPGSCVASGGVAVGEVKPILPRYFCCQAEEG